MRQAAKLAAKIVVTGGLLWVVIAHADLAAIAGAASRLGAGSLVAGLAILFALTAAQALRWRIVAGALGSPLPFRRSWRYVLLGLFFSQFLPTSIGGDVIRVWKLHREGYPLQPALNSVALDRLVALAAAVLISLAGAPLLLALFPGTGPRTALALFFAGGLAGFALLLLATRWRALARLLERLPPFARGGRHSARVFLAPRIAAPTLAISVAMHLAVSLVIWLLALDAGARVGLVTCMVVVPMVLLMSMLPVRSPAGRARRRDARRAGRGRRGRRHGRHHLDGVRRAARREQPAGGPRLADREKRA